jgi:hypothetical protein
MLPVYRNLSSGDQDLSRYPGPEDPSSQGYAAAGSNFDFFSGMEFTLEHGWNNGMVEKWNIGK